MSGFTFDSPNPSFMSNGSIYDRHGCEIAYVDNTTGMVRDSTYGTSLGRASDLNSPGVNSLHHSLENHSKPFSPPSPLDPPSLMDTYSPLR